VPKAYFAKRRSTRFQAVSASPVRPLLPSGEPRRTGKSRNARSPPSPKTATNGRRFYTVEDLIAIREALGIKVGKAEDERAVVVAVQNFKGGVSKSTTSKHLADYLALRGYRVLVVDCDPQASMSVMFDVNLEELIDDTHTLSISFRPKWMGLIHSARRCAARHGPILTSARPILGCRIPNGN
jgi:Mrp family chromosome partitioning ATPase